MRKNCINTHNGDDSFNLLKFYMFHEKKRERENTIFIKMSDKAKNFIS